VFEERPKLAEEQVALLTVVTAGPPKGRVVIAAHGRNALLDNRLHCLAKGVGLLRPEVLAFCHSDQAFDELEPQ
jgi:hypothetical protein